MQLNRDFHKKKSMYVQRFEHTALFVFRIIKRDQISKLKMRGAKNKAQKAI